MNLFKTDSYTEVLEAHIAQKEWGSQTRLAQAAGCQRSYLSQVLKGHATLTQDQAIGISEYLGFTADETQYFLLQVSLARAATAKLKEFYRERLKQLREQKDDLARRFEASAITDGDKQAIYHSSWEMMAVHILAGIPQFQTVGAISERLSLRKETVMRTLNALAEIGLVEEFKRGHWRNTTTRLHLPKESPLTPTNHSNWRQRAIQDSASRRSESLHYTAVMSIAKRDIPALKAILLEAIDKSRDVIKKTEKEDLVCICCDLFEV